MKITLPTGTILEPENKEELRWVLAELGVTGASATEPPSIAPVPAAAPIQPQGAVGAVGPGAPSPWTRVTVDALLTKVAEGARRLIKMLVPADVTNDEGARLLGYEDNRPLGGLMGGLRTQAASMGLPSPVTSADVDGVRWLLLDPEFRRIVTARGGK